jgi:hypothetical protein
LGPARVAVEAQAVDRPGDDVEQIGEARCPNADSAGATRAMAPPAWWMWISLCGVGLAEHLAMISSTASWGRPCIMAEVM